MSAKRKKYKTFDIHCGKCREYVLTYHKYGAGKGILQLYHSNIAKPQTLVDNLTKDYKKVKEVPNLICQGCEEVLGVPIESKGQKWAFRMRQGLFHRKLKK